MNTVQLTFGRNIGNKPMDELPWEAFKEMLADALVDLLGKNLILLEEYHEGTGSWQGIEEISGKITILYSKNIVPWRLTNFYANVRAIKQAYGQESIAFVIGSSELI